MMKRKILAVILPIIGCATVVGSGFSAWYFGQDVAVGTNGNTSIGMNITEEVQASTANLSINLDATTIDDGESAKDGLGRLILDQGGAGNNSENSGIMFGSTTSTVTTETEGEIWGFTISYDGASGKTVGEEEKSGLSIKELYDAGLRIRVEMSVTLDATLYKYIGFQGKDTLPAFSVESSNLTTEDETAKFGDNVEIDKSSGSAKITANYIVDVAKLVDSNVDSMALTFELNLDTKLDEGRTDYSNKLFVYQENNTEIEGEPYNGGKPHFSSELKTMRGEIASKIINFTVVAHIEDDSEK